MMLEFQTLTFENAFYLKKYFDQNTAEICDQTFGTVLMWRKILQTEFYDGKTYLLLRNQVSSEKKAYGFPLGDWESGLKELRKAYEKDGIPPIFSGISEQDREKVRMVFPEWGEEPLVDWFDYVYPREQMVSFAGKKMSGQRNHRNAFLRFYPNWDFQIIDSSNVSAVLEYVDRYSEENPKNDLYFQEELDSIREVLQNFSATGLLGAILTVEGKIVGMTIGEVVNDMVFVHAEKADREIRGAYPMLSSEFLRKFTTSDVLFVNREEDMGEIGLRTAKQAYHPSKMMKKYLMEK